MNNHSQSDFHKHIIQRIEVGGGLKAKEFNPLYESLDPEQQETIRWVSYRLRLAYYLRYDFRLSDIFESHMMMKKGDDAKWMINAALPTLEIYLLFTCLDTLAGSKHQQFENWIDSNLEDELLSKDQIKQLFKKYKDQAGVGSNLRKLFMGLPEVTKKWLEKNCVFRKVPKNVYDFSVDYDPKSYRLLNENPELTSGDDTVLFLQGYFYENWRNPFTHQSRTRATHIADFINPANDVLELPPFPLYSGAENMALNPQISYPPRSSEPDKPQYVGRFRRRKNQYWQLYLSDGLDEATVLKVIIQSYIYQILGIDPNRIYTYLEGLKLQSVLRWYALSTKSNMDSLPLECW